MADHAAINLQTRIFAILSGDVGAGSIASFVAGRIYDHVPENPVYPCISMGDAVFLPFGSHTHSGFEVTQTFRVHSQSAGRKEARQIMARLFQLFHKADLLVPDFPTLSCEEINNQVIREDDSKTHLGFQQFRILLAGNSA